MSVKDTQQPLVMTRASLRAMLATVWDSAIASIQYEDGSKPDILTSRNPYRDESEDER